MKILDKIQNCKVEWKKINNIKEIELINGNSFKSTDYIEKKEHNNGIRVIRISDVLEGKIKNNSLEFKFVSANLNKKIEKFMLKKNDILISLTGNIGRVAMLNTEHLPAVLNQRVLCIRTSDPIFARYLYFYLNSNDFRNYTNKKTIGAAQRNLNIKWIKEYKIPIPDIDIQKEIIEILDKFTEFNKELNKELNLRKKQFDYYLNKLLTFNNNEVEWEKLGNITEKNKFKQISANKMKELKQNNGDIKLLPSSNNYDWVTNMEKIKTLNLEEFIYNSEIITLGRARYANIKYYNGKFISSNNITITSKNSKILLNKYLYYFLLKNVSLFYIKTGTYPKFSTEIFNNLKIPIPDIEKQKEIIEILDKFHILTNSITEGLPKEIELRNKQFNYYLNKLLDFKKDENE